MSREKEKEREKERMKKYNLFHNINQGINLIGLNESCEVEQILVYY